jgi:hypothetical protein
VGKGRRKTALRNLYSYKERRRGVKNGGYPKEAICPDCGRAIVKNGEHCRDCKKYQK